MVTQLCQYTKNQWIIHFKLIYGIWIISQCYPKKPTINLPKQEEKCYVKTQRNNFNTEYF